MTFQRSGIELVIDTSDLDQIARKAAAADKSLDGVVDAANRADRALSGIADVDVNVDVDTSRVTRAQSEIDSLSQSEDVNLSADASRVQGTLDQVQKELETLKALAVIDIVLSAASFVQDIPNLPFISTLIEIDSLTARITGRVGAEIPGAAKIIEDIYTAAWGESREEIAGVLTEVARLGIEQDKLGSVTTLAFQVADVSGKDPTEILGAMNKLVANDLVPNFETAADFLATGFQRGFDRSGDFLDTVEEYAPVFKDAGLKATDLFAILDGGLKAGARDTDKLADAFKEMFNLTREDVAIKNKTGDETDRTKALEEIGQFDEATLFAQGQLAGAEFARGVLEALQAEPDPETQRRIALAIFGPSMVEDLGLPTLLAIDIEENSSVIEAAWDGVAVRSSDAFNNTLSTKLTELSRTIESEISSALNTAFDVDEAIAKVKAAVPEIAKAIREGSSISQALEEGLDLEGAPLQKLESLFNNLAISFMQGIQAILGALGKGDEAAALGTEIARIAGGQFAFDLKLADDGAALQGTIQTALDRGVSAADIGEALNESLLDQLARGDLLGADKTLAALKEFVETPIDLAALNFSSSDAEIRAQVEEMLSLKTMDLSFIEENAQLLAAQYSSKFADAVAAGDYEAALPLAEQLAMDPAIVTGIEEMIRIQGELQTETEETATANESASTRTSAAVNETNRSIADYVASSGEQLDINVEKFIAWEASVSKNVDVVAGKIDGLAGKLGGLNESIATIGEPAQPADATPHARGGTAYGRSLVGEEGPEMVDFPARAGIINAANTSVLMRALDSLVGSRGGGGGNVTNNIYLNNSVSTQSTAQADAFGYRVSKQVRGFS